MKIAEVKELIEKSEIFTNWKAEHNKAVLMSMLTMFEDKLDNQWLASYFDMESKQITTFFFNDKNCNNKQEEPYTGKAREIDISKAKIEIEEAIKTAREALAEKEGSKPIKIIAILQTLENEQVWNISFMTPGFKIFNAKINSENGQLMSQDYGDMFATV